MSTAPHAPSYYAASAHPSAPRPPLQASIEADICIVGAGYTGLNAGISLAEAGFKVVVLEQNQVGWGASGRNGGQVVHSYSRDIDVIESNLGKALAEPLGRMMFEGAQILRERVATYNIQCDLKPGGVYAATSQRKIHALKEQKERWEKWGHKNLTLMESQSDIRKVVNSERYEALLVDTTGGHFHPLNLALGEANALEQLGGVIHEHSGVTKIDRGTHAVVHTAQGQVKARFVIVACNAYIGDLEPTLAAKSMPCGTQVVATEPLGALGDELIPSDYCVEDNNFLLDYFRLSADKRLIFGGGVVYGARDPAHVESPSFAPKCCAPFRSWRARKSSSAGPVTSFSPCPACRKWADCRTTSTTHKAAQATASPSPIWPDACWARPFAAKPSASTPLAACRTTRFRAGGTSGCRSPPWVRFGMRCGTVWGFEGGRGH